MAAGLVNLPLVWDRLWRRTTLTTKALVVSVVMGGLLWLIADVWQTVLVREIFQKEQLANLEAQAQRDRLLFDGYLRGQEQAVRLLSYLASLVHRVAWMQEDWAAHPNREPILLTDHRPSWLPPPSVTRNLIAAPYVLLLDAHKRVREIYLQGTELPPLPHTVLAYFLPRLLNTAGHTHIAAHEGIIYLINVSGISGHKASENPKAFLVFVVPLNDDFLSLFHRRSDSSNVVALINGETNRVFASSRPDRISTGMTMEELTPQFAIFGKKFLDYDFSIDIPIHFATLVEKAEMDRLSNSIVRGERTHLAIGYGALTIIFFLLVYYLTRRLKIFTEGMIDAAIGQLGIKKQTVAAGDQLLIMGEQFQWMIQEILHSRQREQTRQEELQKANEALRQSLEVVKSTQGKLVESEKMASLGNLVAGVAHEINTPVGSGVTAASYLRQQSVRCADHFAQGTLRKSELEAYFKDVVESTQMILQNLNRAAELVRSFKQVAVDRTHEQRRRFYLAECIQQTLVSLRPHLKKTQHKVTVDCPETLEIDSYPGAFSQIITNFVINSLLHGFHEMVSGDIVFRIVEVEGNVIFRYSDSGRGMEEEDRLRIFEPFFTTARSRGGSGLGMHIVYNLVTQTLGGTIQCSSHPGRGTVLEIILPVG
ncbi:MAG: HAMP domain-containing histidine kinase [Magnetococcales bacterium]|nr:HAMP domain-containing histidine kinase [Magnetococcales bacterium]